MHWVEQMLGQTNVSQPMKLDISQLLTLSLYLTEPFLESCFVY
jgi:hypothetical protein